MSIFNRSRKAPLASALAEAIGNVHLCAGEAPADKALRVVERALVGEIARRVAAVLAAYQVPVRPANFVAAVLLRLRLRPDPGPGEIQRTGTA